MPPPNVTGYLHMGHAIFIALQDIMSRFHRMRGRPTLWLPGTDHAGIATQLSVERQLAKEGTSRLELGREAFLDKVWQWKDEKGGYITQQMRRLGASADWSREKFTLQPEMSEAVTEAFVRLHEKGLIYRGSYMVNWSPHLQTAVSDLEVEHSEEQSTLYFFKYMLVEGGEFIPVATTRPETILGDSAVCVHPDDVRYQHHIGKMVRVPLSDRLIPVIADEYVDREFGTGALKITPAHDVNDYALGKKHNLPLISIMNKDASINELGGKYAGLSREQCRIDLWCDLVQAGLAYPGDASLEGVSSTGTKAHVQRVPRSQRGGEVIEPMVSKQWFVTTEHMAQRAVQAVRSGEIAILPAERFEKVWYNWLENIHDWCISRQLWWGHRIPVYYVTLPTGSAGAEVPYIVARSAEEARRIAEEKYGPGVVLTQDEDVLDTWFSSGLWPFATVGWPHQEIAPAASFSASPTVSSVPAGDLARFYPASVLETGYDILFFWVARMVMLGLELTDQVPFRTIYLHGLVRDAQGQKMSKTKGNVMDPLDTIDKLGADALRYTLVTGSTPGNDVPLAMEKIEGNRNFVNKLWNAGKYIQICLAGLNPEELAALAVRGPMNEAELTSLPVPERFIVSRCHEVATRVTESLEAHGFGESGRLVHDFLWDEFADWYVEASKVRMRSPGPNASAEETARYHLQQRQTRRVLVYVWDTCMRLLHPFMPYLTETLWQLIPHDGESIMLADWPQMQVISSAGEEGDASDAVGVESKLVLDVEATKNFGTLQALVHSIRNARAEYNVDAGKKIPCILRLQRPAVHSLMQNERGILALLGRVDDTQLQILPVSSSSTGNDIPEVVAAGPCVHLVVEEGVEVYLPQAGLIDTVKEKLRLGKQAEKLRKAVEGMQTRLQSAGFVDRAPAHLVEEARNNLRDLQEQLATVEKSLEALN
eukprot:CAMPEP_0184984386 /NCGR_PEP_ID=MMETSP1098-20130426/13368_1 /TAXON_ID=89044 /ORGANISM="Spumella elongata, Strain CCAP 955/1" /LENGTH=935 /DNA_ID=CAMNT_0027508357 /DNA_START=347 /DNA_END=3154 /DNA_ORIENTATION=-